MLKACSCVINSVTRQSLRKNIQKTTGFKKEFTRPISTSSVIMSDKIYMAKRLEGTDKNVWVEFGKLAAEHKAISLGQGFPDFMAPDTVTKALTQTIKSDNPFLNQYTRAYGHPRLVNALAKCYGGVLGRELDANQEICVTIGAYGSLFASIIGLVNPGEEVIIIEPYFDCYEPMVKIAGGKPVFVPLRPTKSEGVLSSSDWKLDTDELSSKFNSNTKAIVLNTPNNPLGKIYSQSELEVIANLCKKHDTIVLADEVYEWMVYTGNKHIKIATLPGMWEHTVTIGSAGKTFSVTGWKLGWSIGPQHLIHAICTVHQNSNYVCPTPIQEAVAIGFETEQARFGTPECYYSELPAELEPKRDQLAKYLIDIGMVPTIPEGGYFMIADFSNLSKKLDLEDGTSDPKDYKFVRWLCKNKKIAAIPPSAFYSKEHKHLAENLIRFCFIKKDETLAEAARIMMEWKNSL